MIALMFRLLCLVPPYAFLVYILAFSDEFANASDTSLYPLALTSFILLNLIVLLRVVRAIILVMGDRPDQESSHREKNA